jgi:cytosine/adenosine deaminase-related metal-dependent hydrolase
MLTQARNRLLLRGKVVQPDGSAPGRYVLIENGRITRISRRKPPLEVDVPLVETGVDDWIFPGLIDLHTHAEYNLIPFWENPPGFPYDNRFEWRGDPAYKERVRALRAYLKRPPETDDEDRGRFHRIELATFAELQAIAGGTTTLQESHDLEETAEIPELNVLCRGTADPLELGCDKAGEVFSVVDFFRPGSSGPNEASPPKPVAWAFEKYLKLREQGRLIATLAHLAEGRSGLDGSGVCPYTRLEFETFMRHPAFADAAAVRASPLSLIHGCGVDPENREHLAFLRERGISLVWSPVSNLLLYGDTLEVEGLLAAGINLALGSDWSPSGSKHVWDEAKFARFYLESLGAAVSDVQIFQMVTANAARCLGTNHLGRLAEGAAADFFILRSPLESDSALEVFFKTTDRDVLAVVVGGEPLYGDRDFLKQFGRDLQPLPRREGSAVVNKVAHLPADLKNSHGETLELDRDLNRLEDMLKHPPQGLPPTRRSNLLASSDTPYRDRLRRLRADTIHFCWRVQRYRHQLRKKGAHPS